MFKVNTAYAPIFLGGFLVTQMGQRASERLLLMAGSPPLPRQWSWVTGRQARETQSCRTNAAGNDARSACTHLARQKDEDVPRERLLLVNLQDGDQCGVQVVRLGLGRVHELHRVLPALITTTTTTTTKEKQEGGHSRPHPQTTRR